MTGPRGKTCVWIAVAVGLASVARAGDDGNLEQAARLAARGDLAAAEASYDALVAAGGGREARLGRAYVRSHRGRQAAAQEDFRAVLAVERDDLGALVGLGYSLAWTGAYGEAERQFRHALAVAPGQADAEMGLAWVALWRGEPAEAASRFEALAAGRPESAEPLVGLGRALSAAGSRREARQAFARALALEPGRADARSGLAELAPSHLRAEATVLGGLSSFAERDELGLRFAELAVHLGAATRLWLQYDDSLSLDTAALAREGVRAPAWWLGGRAAWSARLATRVEGGFRRLPGGVDQWLVRGEQEVGLGRGVSARAGAWLGIRSDDRLESIVHAGVAVPVGRLRLEPAVFLARSGVAGEREVRLLAAAEYELPRGFTLGAGVATGRTTSPSPGADGTPLGAFARVGFPLGGRVQGQALVSQERPGAGPRTTVYALGLTVTGGRP